MKMTSLSYSCGDPHFGRDNDAMRAHGGDHADLLARKLAQGLTSRKI